MERLRSVSMAKNIVKELTSQGGPTLSVLEAVCMQKIVNDGKEMYAIQKGNNTFLASPIYETMEGTYFEVKVVSW